MDAFGFPVWTENSLGNYISDVDGNQYLDTFTSMAAIGAGYNHPKLIEVCKSDAVTTQLATRSGIGLHPHKFYKEQVQKAFLDVAPKGLDRVGTMMCGSCATESTFKLAMIAHGQKKRGGMAVPPTKEELDACVDNCLPAGSANVGVLSFKTGYHGRMFGSNSSSSCSPIQKVDTP